MWNDAAAICLGGAVLSLVLMVVLGKIEARKASKRGEWIAKY